MPTRSESSVSPEGAAERLRAVSDDASALARRIAQGEIVERPEFSEIAAGVRAAERAILGPRKRAKAGEGASLLMLDYLMERVGQVVTGEELREVAGIQAWPRRIRELRVERGYDISEVGDGDYRLNSKEPDQAAASKWLLANTIRKRPGAAIDRIEMLLLQYVGQVVTGEEIAYVGKIRSAPRRVRELRDERGWPLESNMDSPDLAPGDYRLVSADIADRLDRSQRLYEENARHRVFVRDDFTCRECKRNRELADRAGDKRFYLEVHHEVAVADELAELPKSELNKIENLITLCHACHRKETAKLHATKRKRRSSAAR